MKKALSISVAAFFAYIQLFNAFVWYSYELNKAEIIEQFCINKDKPELKCEGTCHMKDMMLSQDNEEEGKSMPELLPETLLYMTESIEIEWDLYSIDQSVGQIQDLYHLDFVSDIYTPPKFIV